MKTILKVSLLLFVMGSSYEMNAMLTTKVLHPQSVTQKKKLKFKERAVLWVLKRKLKKQRKKYQAKLQMLNDSTVCSKIYLKTGDVIDADILEITEKNIRFLSCDNESGEMILSKSDIDRIVYGNGALLYENSTKSKSKRKKKEPESDIGLYLGLGSVVLSVLAFLLLFGNPGAGLVVAGIAAILGVVSMGMLSGTQDVSIAVLGLVISLVSGVLGIIGVVITGFLSIF